MGNSGSKHVPVISLKAFGYLAHATQHPGHRLGFLIENPCLLQGIVTTGADDKMSGVIGKALKLVNDLPGHIAIDRQSRRLPWLTELGLKMPNDGGAFWHVGSVVEDGVTEEDDVVHS